MKIIFSKDTGHPPIRVENPVAAGPNDNERMETIDMKYKDESEILAEFLKITDGEKVSPTEEEQRQLQESCQQLTETEQDRKRSRLDLQTKAREKQLLHQARQGVGGIAQ